MYITWSIAKFIAQCLFIFSSNLVFAQIAKVDVNSKEYVEWVGTCETLEIEKAMSEGLESLSSFEKIKYYIDTRRCKYKNQSKGTQNMN